MTDDKDKRQPENKRADEHPHHHEPRVPRPLQRARDDDVRRIEEHPAGHQPEKRHAKRMELGGLRHVRRREERENRTVEDERQSADERDEPERQRERPPERDARRRVVTASAGLSDQRLRPQRKAHHRRKYEIVHRKAGVGRRQRHVTDPARHEDEHRKGNHVQELVESGRHPESENLRDNRTIEPSNNRTTNRLVVREMAANRHGQRHPLDRRRKDSGIGRAGDAHPRHETPAEDQDRIERDVEEISEEIHPEDDPREAPSREVRRRRHLSVDEDAAEDERTEIGPLQREDLRRRSGQPENPVTQQEHRQHQHARNQCKRNRRTIAGPAHAEVLRTVILRDKHARIADDGLEEAHEHPGEHARRQHRLQRRHRIVRQIRPVRELHDRIVDHAERQRPDQLQDLQIRLQVFTFPG